MSLLSALGSAKFQAPALATFARQADNKAGRHDGLALVGPDPVSLSRNGVNLSAQDLANHAKELGNTTIDVAQNFIANFAQQLFGDAAKGATLSFDSASLSAQAGFSSLVQHSEGPNGTGDLAAFSLNQSAHFIGKGKITTADGQSFEFEVEVRYESRIEAAATRTTNSGNGQEGAGRALPSARLPDIDFAGGLSDLFKLLGHPLQGELPSEPPTGVDADQAGTLTLRLLKLINNTPQDATTAPTQAHAKALAKAYAAPAFDSIAPALAAA